MARARIASEIAGWPDDTTLNEGLSAIYLGVSVSLLESGRAKPKDPDNPRGFEGPEMIKIIGQGAVGQNQRVNYKLGALRAYQAKNTSKSSFDSALKAGKFLGTVTTAYAQPRGVRGRADHADFRLNYNGPAHDGWQPR